MDSETKQYQKGMTREILTIGVPSFLETLFTTFVSVIDSKMVSAMGTSAISAVSVTNQPRLFIFSIFFAFNTVTTSLVAKYNGAEDQEGANRVFDHVLKISVLLSLALGLLAALLARPIMILFSGQADTLNDSIIYYRIIMGGMIFNIIFLVINAALRGFGKTTLTFTDNVVSCVVNLFFNYLLIEGHWGFPRWGVAGAAVATVLGNVAACLVGVVFVCNKKLFINIPYCISKRYHMTKDSVKEIWTMTKSCAIDNLSMRATLLVISGVTARIGSFQMAIYSIGNYLLNVNYALGSGLQTSAVTLIGRSYGEEDYRQLADYRKRIMKIGMISAVVLGVLIAGCGRPFFQFFSDDEVFVSIGGISCLFIGIISIFQVMKFINSGCLQGVGKMKEVAFCSIFAFSGVNLVMVVVLVLVFKLEIWGVWTSTLLSQTTQALLLGYFIRKSGLFTGNPPETIQKEEETE